jgi:NAD(P)H-flavin reductase
MEIINFPAPGNKPGNCHATKEFLRCELKENQHIGPEIYRLSFLWQGPAPRSGQFFMIKPEHSGVFLGRPISAAVWNPSNKTVQFLIERRGTGTIDITAMFPGEYAELTGPLGNTWLDCLPGRRSRSVNKKTAALIGGGIGVAPLQAFAGELPELDFDFYAGFKTGFADTVECFGMLGPAANAGIGLMGNNKLIIATEDGSEGHKGLITDFLEPKNYTAVFACGPLPMLKAIARKCRSARVRCLVSMEQYMACGVGACLGCTIKTIHGNRRCCADGPIFLAKELCFDE